VYRLDSESGKLSAMAVAAESIDPSFVAAHPNGKYLYAVNEVGNYGGKASGAVSAYAIDRKTGKLALLNQVPSGGADPCYVSLDMTGKYVLVANYTGGSVAVFPVLEDGRLGPTTAFVQYQGSSVNKERQEGPHAHWIGVTPGNLFVLVADLGLDEVLLYRFDESKGLLLPHEPAFAPLDPGAGPRHIAIHPSGRFVYVLNELKSTVTVYSVAAQKKNQPYLVRRQQVSALPKNFSGRNDAAEIAVHPDGKYVYASNRGHDSIAVFAIDEAGGTLSTVADVPTGGKEPRQFAIDPTGKFLLAENQESNNIVVFKIDPATGGLTPTGQVIEVPSPVDLTFVAAE
jgi:6-phosphogluconolactonase